MAETRIHADLAVRREELVRRWNEIGANPDSPDYYEMNEFGEVIREKIRMKTAAYLHGGAKEVIVVGLKGEVELFGSEGKRARSAFDLSLELPAELF